jgi:hypothetical protein
VNITETMHHLWTLITPSPLFGVTLTVLVYAIGLAIQRACGGAASANPVLISILLISCLLKATGTPEGFPLAYEVLAGNTSDKTTLRDFLKKIEAQYGKAERTWQLRMELPDQPPPKITTSVTRPSRLSISSPLQSGTCSDH